MKVRLPLLLLATFFGAIAFSWPLYIPSEKISGISQTFLNPTSAKWFSVLIAFAAIALVAIEINRGILDSKSVALLGVLTALVAALRLIGAGAIGVEPIWFLIILAARVFGARFGFTLGALSLGLSAFLTGGIGPWLPFQMMAAAWIGAGTGILPKRFRGKPEIFLLVIYAIIAAEFFGAAMDLQLWPWVTGSDSQLSFIPGAAVFQNLKRFLIFHFATAMAWDIPRAIFTSALIVVSAKPVLGSLRRANLKLNPISRARVEKVAL